MVFNSQTYCALVILLELTESYLIKGRLLKEISIQHRIPIEELEEAVIKLEQAKFVIAQHNIKEWLFLCDEPSHIRIINVIELFAKKFMGRFVDPESGRIISPNNTLRFLSEKQTEIEANLKSRWYNITLDRLYQMKMNRHM